MVPGVVGHPAANGWGDGMDSRTLPQVRAASSHDAAVVAEILSDAFRDDPVMRWLIPDARHRSRLVRAYFGAAVQHLYLPRGRVFLSDGDSGAALCLPPGVSAGSLPILAELSLVWQVFRTAGLAGLSWARSLQAEMRANHLAEPRYYVHAVGVRATEQGRGVGSALMRHVTRHCDRERLPACLENTNERNLPLYGRNGFTVVRELRVFDGGPPIWFMVRDPCPAPLAFRSASCAS
jgi:GNAT superfamily N-acetyltransferase